MEPSSTHAAGLQRRQFGRRDTSRSAVATLPGRPPVACTVLNLSEGGALIQFGSAAVPDRNFRLVLDDAPFTLICEIRHQNADRIGVRFLSHADNRALRQQVLGSIAERTRAAEAEAAAVKPAEPLRQRLQEGLRSAFSAFGREGHAEPAPGPASNGQPEPTASPVAKPSIWPDEPLNYQPRRSRKNGIKGKSAGGIG